MTQCIVFLSYFPLRKLPVTPALAQCLLQDGLVTETMVAGVFNLGVTKDALWAYLKRRE